jgi:hypothetical protein
MLKSFLLNESPFTRTIVRLLAGPGPITMLLLVRDEQDIVRQNIDFHLRLGVDSFVITDNGSVDGTREVLAEYERSLGKRFLVIDDPETAYHQAQRVNRMIELAKERLRPKWIFSADADEFWYPESGTYTSDLDGRANVLDCYWHNFLPRADAPWESFSDMGEMPGYHNRMKKVFCLSRSLFGMYTGNHEARTVPRVTARSSNIRVYHYPVRSYAQFERKVLQGYKAISSATNDQHASWHWREYYQAWQAGRLPEVYADLASKNRTGEDRTMADLFRSAHR